MDLNGFVGNCSEDSSSDDVYFGETSETMFQDVYLLPKLRTESSLYGTTGRRFSYWRRQFANKVSDKSRRRRVSV